MHVDLVGGFNPSEKILVSWDDYSHILLKIKNVWNHQPEETTRL